MSGSLQQVADASKGLAREAMLFSDSATHVEAWTPKIASLVCPATFKRRKGFWRAAQRSASRGWPVVMRATGGGAVPQSADVLNVTLAFTAPAGFTVEDGYRLITDSIKQSLHIDGACLKTGSITGSFCDGTWNLAIGGRKIVGTAQRLRRTNDGKVRVLIHALLLMRGDVAVGVSALNAFHTDMGLEAVNTDAHMTIESALAARASSQQRITDALIASACHNVREIAAHTRVCMSS